MEHTYGGARRRLLRERMMKDEHGQNIGPVLLVGAFEQAGRTYQADAYVRYYTGLTDPGLCVIIDERAAATVFEPTYAQDRTVWVSDRTARFARSADKNLSVHTLGDPCTSYHASLWAPLPQFKHLVAALSDAISAGKKIGILATPVAWAETTQTLLLRLAAQVPRLQESLVDCGMIAAYQRSVKSSEEIQLIQDAVQLTVSAQMAATSYMMQDDIPEKTLAAMIESYFLAEGDGASFEPIIAGGRHGAILHHTPADQVLSSHEMVLIDIGARKAGYCGDITRTYPGDGQRYSRDQKVWYDLVYEAQQYAESITKPGMWLNNAAQPEQSVHHLVVRWFAQRQVDQYFLHGIGHYLGLEVHDVGDYRVPLEPGMVITLEPGLYSAQKGMGIRLEDNYLITSKGLKRLSHELPQSAQQVVGMMQSIAQDIDSEEEEDENDWQ